MAPSFSPLHPVIAAASSGVDISQPLTSAQAAAIDAGTDQYAVSGLGNQPWHSDSSYKKIPARYSLLNAHVLPPVGGDTQFADMRAAYNRTTMHRARPYDDASCPRDLRRTTVTDGVPTVG